MSETRNYTFADRIISHLDQGLKTVAGGSVPDRENPAGELEDGLLSTSETAYSIGLMRVDHAGEVSAQALYQGQAVTARDPEVRRSMERAAEEENDHLHWCRQRLNELGGRPSLLDPIWYTGSFVIGAVSGMLGDRVSLGFLAETERQVVAHLDEHLERLPAADIRSREILRQMRSDEERHATSAVRRGAIDFPTPVQRLMRSMSKVMTATAFWV